MFSVVYNSFSPELASTLLRNLRRVYSAIPGPDQTSVGAGEAAAVMCPPYGGMSTLLKLDRPTGGTVEAGGVDLG